MNEYLTLVDENDLVEGKEEKLLVHQLGLLHRAFSVFIFNSIGELLLQQRADTKYHSAGLWTNTCCSHPRFGEELNQAVDRRLVEEMGMICETKFVFNFIYRATFDNGLTEYEFDHVYFGVSDYQPAPDETEVKDWKYVNVDDLEKDVYTNPQLYTEWMKICLPTVKSHLGNIINKTEISKVAHQNLI